MKKMNKKGFTLIELLAVIVVLAIVMVIATQRITNVVNNSRANSFVSSYKTIVKQINTNIVADPDSIVCANMADCQEKYDISSDYELTVTTEEESDYYEITLSANTTDGKFKNLDLTKYGDASAKDKKSCDTSKVDNTVVSCKKSEIIGHVTK